MNISSEKTRKLQQTWFGGRNTYVQQKLIFKKFIKLFSIKKEHSTQARKMFQSFEMLTETLQIFSEKKKINPSTRFFRFLIFIKIEL